MVAAMSKGESWRFFLLMVAFFTLAWFQQAQQGRQDVIIERQKTGVVALCIAQNEVSDAHNELIEELQISVRDNKDYDAERKNERLAQYAALKLELAKC